MARNRANLLAWRRKSSAKTRKWLTDFKLKAGCKDCGYNSHPSVLSFDHVRGEKLFNLADTNKRSLKQAKAEVEKCEVRCANCHMERTYPIKEKE